MPGRICFHCKNPVAEGESHDCWSTTEQALTAGLSGDLQEAWERLRETAAALGEQRIYASHHCIMFSRKSCYFFVRPKKAYLEVCVFLGRTVKAPQIRRTAPSSRTKYVHNIRIQHRDEVERPLTDWLHEAYEFAGQPARKAKRSESKKQMATRKSAIKRGTRKATGQN